MEQKKISSNNNYFDDYANKENCSLMNNKYKKEGIKKNNHITNSNAHNIINQNNLTIFNDSRAKQNKINQCFLDLMNTKKQKEKVIKKERRCLNQEINPETNDFDNKSNNIRVNKIKIEKLNIENANNVNFKTNRDFYKITEAKTNSNLINNESRISTRFISDFCDDKKTNLLTVKSFYTNNSDKDKDKDRVNTIINNLENDSFMKIINKKYNINNIIYANLKKMNQSNIKNKTIHNSITQSYIRNTTNNSSKTLKSYKNIKTFYAHLEIFICLYLKRFFKLFLETIKNYEKQKNNINNIELDNDNNLKGANAIPASNVNKARCSLFGSINLNKNKLFNTIIDNQNKCSIINNSFTPITKRRMIENSKQFSKEKINNINKKNKLLFNHPECERNTIKKRSNKDFNQKSVYVPKKKISKSKTDIVNRVKVTSTLNNNKNYGKKSFPIKEMNINLKKINVCRLNELNHLYLNQNLYNCNNINNNFNYTEVTPIITINNNYLTNYIKNNNNNIHSINIDSPNINMSSDKYKLKKIRSAKNGIYTKPKEKKLEKKIKEIKIKNKFTPLKKEIETNKRYKNKNGSLITLHNSFSKGENMNVISKIKKTDLYTINNNQDESVIKKIYIKTKQKSSNNFKKKQDLFDSYNNQFYSTFISYKGNNEKKIKDVKKELLIKELITSDKRLYIRIKYYLLMDNNYIRRQNNCLKSLNWEINHQDSISIVNNVFNAKNTDNYKNPLLTKCKNNSLRMLDIYSFDNDKNEKSQIIRTKNISFSFKECSRSKEENNYNNVINERLIINFINTIKNKITINIRKYLYKKYKIKLLFSKIINNYNYRIIKFYFNKYKNKINSNQNKIDINNYGVYHKINYNDDFNLNKKNKSTTKKQKIDNNNNIQIKTKPYNLTAKNSINQFNNKRVNNKKEIKEFSPNNTIMNKEINIVVHNNMKLTKNNKNSDILINSSKSKLFS